MFDYLFNMTFTRPDENDATVYHCGSHVTAPSHGDAEGQLRERHDHLTIRTVSVFAIYDDCGETVIYNSAREPKTTA